MEKKNQPNNLNYYLSGDIEDYKILDFVSFINDIEDKNSTVNLYISSDGGDAIMGLFLYDFVKKSNIVINTYAVGKCMSSAFLIFLAGHNRYAHKNTIFMYHAISMNDDTNHTHLSLQAETKLMKKLTKNMIKLVKNETHLPKKKLKQLHCLYLSEKKALKYKIIQKIV